MEAILGDPGLGGVSRDPGFAYERLTAIAEHQATISHRRIVRALLFERVFHLENIGEVGPGGDLYLESNIHSFMIEDCYLLVKASADRARTDDREVSIHIHRAGARDEKELG